MSETINQIDWQRIGAEFDNQSKTASPFTLIKNVFTDFANGPLILGLGAVGGGGAGEKARGILEELADDRVPFVVVAMKKYLEGNPLITKFLNSRQISINRVKDNVDIPDLYENTLDVVRRVVELSGSASGILSLGPRTYYPEVARRLNLKAMIIDGAVPDKWEEVIDPVSNLPKTEYHLPAYLNTAYATTCGFAGWFPPQGKFPEGMDLNVVAQPFSRKKIAYLKSLRNLTPTQCREILLEKGGINCLDRISLIVIPTFDQVYLDPKALSVFGRFLTPEQLGQTFGFMAELIASLVKLYKLDGREIGLYLKPGIIRNMLSPLLSEFETNGFRLINPQNGEVPNEDWLLLRKAGVTVGRSPLCVSTAEALGMGDYQVTAAVPGQTSDGISYMTESEALRSLNNLKITRTLFPGESLFDAINEVIKVKKL